MLAPITKAELQAAIVSATEARDIAFMDARAAMGARADGVYYGTVGNVAGLLAQVAALNKEIDGYNVRLMTVYPFAPLSS